MIRAIPLILMAALAVIPGCKIVYDDDNTDVVPVGPEGDEARNNARLDETFDSDLLPHISEKALKIAEFRTKMAAGLDSVGEAYGNRGAGIGVAWNFSIRGEGRIIEAKLDTSARTLDVDTDDDGKADITVQLGPVIRGTALRDVAPFYNFNDFRDQIEFAKLSRAINERIKPTLVVPEGELVGGTIAFLGVVPMKKADDKMVLTPISFEIAK